MHCAPSHWFTSLRLSLLCGGGGVRPTTILEQDSSDKNDDNGNELEDDSIEEELMVLLQQIASGNGFNKPMFDMAAASKAGDNYVGRVLRGVIHEDGSNPKRSLSVIFKLAPASKNRRDALNTGVMFQNEGKMYQVVLPALNAFLKEYGLSKTDTYPGTARCLAAKISDNPGDNAEDILVLEDLAPEGYGMLQITTGLDYEACRLALLQLAHLHGTSLAFRHLRPNDAAQVESLMREVLFDPGAPLLKDITAMAKGALVYFEDRFPPNTNEYKKIEFFLDHFAEVMMELATPSDHSCVTHGDCWGNNVLFKMNKNKQAEKACLIDFQISRVASPALDVSYLFFTSTTKEIREAHYQKLLKEYYTELSTILSHLGCDVESIMSWSDFQNELKAYGKFGLGMALVAVPLILTDSSEAVDLDAMMEQENATLTDMVNKNSKYQNDIKTRLSDVLQDCIELGYM